MAKYVGVDWAKNCWLCVVIDDGPDAAFHVERQPSIHTLWHAHEDAASIFVDIPIGLSGGEGNQETVRDCDVAAKDKLGENSSKVFYTPCREAVHCQEWEEASQINRDQLGRGISGQAWSIVPRIREVDLFLSNEDIENSTLVESHPEICFTALAKDTNRSIESSKDTDAGLEERINVLKSVLEDDELYIQDWDEFKEKYEDSSSPSFGRLVGKGRMDDLVDSLGLAVSAYLAKGEYQSLPSDSRPDSNKLPQIVYHDPQTNND